MMWIEFSGALLLVAICVIYVCFPIFRNRFLFGNKNVKGALSASMLFVIGCVLSLSGLNHKFKFFNPSDLLASQREENVASTFSSQDNLFAILSQFLDPGNLPSAGKEGRIWAGALAFAGIILLSGLIVSTFISSLSKKSDKWRKGRIHYKCICSLWPNTYTVIIGVNELTAAIVKQALSSGARYVLIQTRQDVEKMRERLDLGLDKHDEKKLVFYYGERTSEEDIKALKINWCREVFILGEDLSCEDEKDHDSYNIKCVELIADRLKKQSGIFKFFMNKQLRCHVNFEYQGTFTAFKATHHYADLQKIVRFLPFNIHDIWAKKVLVDNFAVIPGKNKGELVVQKYLPIDSYRDNNQKIHYITKDNVNEKAKSVHLVIIGMNQMGTALGIQAALMAHYPNFKFDRNLRTTITFIDDHAEKEGEFLRGRFEALFNLCRYRTIICDKLGDQSIGTTEGWIDPLDPNTKEGFFKHLGGKIDESSDDYNFMDVQWEFIQGDVASEKIADYLRLVTEADKEKKEKTTTIAICFNDPQQAIATALYLPGKVVRNANQLLVYQQNSFDLLERVAKGESDWKRYRNLSPFGMIDGAYTGKELENTAAKIQNYLFFHQEDTVRLKSFDPTLFEPITTSWNELGMILRQSNIDLAESIPTKLRSIRDKDYKGNPNNIELTDDVVEAMTYSEHLRWVTQKLVGGFRPLFKNELDEVIINGCLSKDRKEFYKRTKRAHLDICSYEQLRGIEKELFMPGRNNDENVIKSLPLLLRCSEWLNRKNVRGNFLGKELIKFIKKCGLRHVPTGTQGNVSLRNGRWMCASPVTRYQWYCITGRDKPNWLSRNLPKVNVSKDDIDDFLLILRKRTGLYFSLPSLKEWEYVARNTSSHMPPKEYRWKYLISIHRWKFFWEAEHFLKWSHKLPKNDFGIHDLLGNVWEWTRESVEGHDNCYYFCGGSWRFGEKECNLDMGDIAYWKTYWDSKFSSDDLGFRLVWKSDTTPDIIDSADRHDKNSIEEGIKAWLEFKDRWAKVESGYFIMGAADADKDAESDEKPQHFVHINHSYEICSIPVTQDLWNMVNETDYKENPSPLNGHDLPQTFISYNDINEFLAKLNSKVSDGYEYRLPTEAEWEYAAKDGQLSDTAKYLAKLVSTRQSQNVAKLLNDNDMEESNGCPVYNKYAGSDIAYDVAWYQDTIGQSVGMLQPVQKKTKNKLGLYDMSGNVWEWCRDYYIADMYPACVLGENKDIQTKFIKHEYADKGFITDPEAQDKTYSAHVFRGGSYLFEERDCRCTKPSYWIDTYKSQDLGFRLVRIKK